MENIDFMFNECISLETLPDISKWKTNKLNTMKGLFQKCQSLKTIPDKLP